MLAATSRGAAERPAAAFPARTPCRVRGSSRLVAGAPADRGRAPTRASAGETGNTRRLQRNPRSADVHPGFHCPSEGLAGWPDRRSLACCILGFALVALFALADGGSEGRRRSNPRRRRIRPRTRGSRRRGRPCPQPVEFARGARPRRVGRRRSRLSGPPAPRCCDALRLEFGLGDLPVPATADRGRRPTEDEPDRSTRRWRSSSHRACRRVQFDHARGALAQAGDIGGGDGRVAGSRPLGDGSRASPRSSGWWRTSPSRSSSACHVAPCWADRCWPGGPGRRGATRPTISAICSVGNTPILRALCRRSRLWSSRTARAR